MEEEVGKEKEEVVVEESVREEQNENGGIDFDFDRDGARHPW